MSKTISALKTIYQDLCERGEIDNNKNYLSGFV